MSSATYLYCLVRDEEAPLRADLDGAPAGVPGATPPRLLAVADGIWLVTADAPLPDYGEEEIGRRLEDLSWVSDRALAHEAVVEHFAGLSGEGRTGTGDGGRAVVPMKLFTLFASDQRAVDHVAGELPRLRDVLDRVSGREEWGVRVRVDRAKAAEAATEPSGEAMGSGRDFLARKKRLRDAARRTPAEARRAAEGAYTELAARAAAALERPVEAAGSVVLDAAFLVPREAREPFEEVVERAARELAEASCELTLTGPWPPYHFVGTEP